MRRCTAACLFSIPRPNDLSAAEERLVQDFRDAATEAIPILIPTPQPHRDGWYYTAEVLEANHMVNMARKLCHRGNTEATRGLLYIGIRLAKDTARKVREEH